MSISAVSDAMFFHAYSPSTDRSNTAIVPSLSNPVLPSSCGAPIITAVSIIQTPFPKSSSVETLSVTSLSSITKCELYIVAVYAAPEPVFRSLIVVSCRSNVVAPASTFISLGVDACSAPITNLVPLSLMSRLVPNFMFDLESGAFIVCCNVYVFVDPSAFHL